MKQSLKTYYINGFSNEYKNRNNRNTPNIDEYFRKLDDQSTDDIGVALQSLYIIDLTRSIPQQIIVKNP